MASESPASDSPDLADELDACLKKLAAGDDSARVRILEICNDRLRELSHRLMGKFARVRRWNDTDDVAQNAAIRLYRALGDTVPASTRGLMGLMVTQIQRELLDLARKHSGPMSYAFNHETNIRDATDGHIFKVEEAAEGEDSDEELPIERWEQFHEIVEKMPEDLREPFKLIWYLGLDLRAAAKTLGCSPRTVGRRWQEALEMVRGSLDEPA
jgi:RNA polymerase sigma-70 factor (ECF subfamily)